MNTKKRLFWADRVAQNVKFHVEHELVLQNIVNEKGWICYDEKTPSGIIHIGSGRGWVIHDTVAKALRDLGLKAKFILSSDDMDPLDKLPKENPDFWEKYMGMPFRNIPSPDPGFDSFAEYYFWEATSKFEEYGIEAKLERTGDHYFNGDFNEITKTALNNADKINQIYNRFYDNNIAQRKLPFNPICEQCGKIGTTRAYAWNSETEVLKYRCEPDLVDWAEGCSYDGEMKPYNGNGKLPWKIEWAAKWPIVGVVYETAGKDHFSAGGSRDVAIAISVEVFNHPPPYPSSYKKIDSGLSSESVTYKRGEAYEFFQIGGAKMSTSKGKGFPFSEMTNYAPGNILKYLLVSKRPKSVIEFDPSKDLERIFRDYDQTELMYFEAVKDSTKLEKDKYFNAKRLYELSHVGNLPSSRPLIIDFNFNFGVMIVQLTETTANAISLLQQKNKLPQNITKREKKYIGNRLDFIRHWVDNLAPPNKIIKLKKVNYRPLVNLEKKLLQDTISLLRELDNDEKKLVQEMNNIIQNNGYNASQYFQLLYNLIFDMEKGPRLSSYIIFAGPKKIAGHLETYL